jgi:uncharacterized repeat protein (TIGR02059 family)
MAVTVEIRTQVSQLYTALFGRAPDVDGLGFWANLVAGGTSITQVADMMYATTPARAYYPAFLGNQAIISSFYVNVLGRTADAGGLAYWTAALNETGATPGSVIVRMIDTVAHYTGSDPAGLVSQQLFLNRVAVAQHYAEAGGGIDAATAVLATVTSDPATATAAIAAIDSATVNAPFFASASVNGGTLVMTYSGAANLDATHLPAVGAFAVTVDGTAKAVNAVEVDAAAKTVTLTLASGVTNGQAVTVAYTDPTSGNDANAIQDASGHDAATLAAIAAANNTPVGADITPPVFSSASVTGTSLVMTYTDASALDATHIPAASAFAVTAAGASVSVTTVAVDAVAKTVTLTLGTAVAGGQAVTVAYTDPTSANDANAIQDTSGNDAATLAATPVTNTAADVTGPAFVSATVDGSSLVMTYDETIDPFNPPPASAFTVKIAGSTVAVNAVTVDSANALVTLTLGTAALNDQAVTVAYTDPTSSDDTLAIQDAHGNDALTLAATTVTNLTPDTTPPVFASATVNGTSLVMKYTELNDMDATNIPATTAFAVKVNGVARTVSSLTVNATSHTVTLKLASTVVAGDSVTVAYTDPTSGDDAHAIQDVSGNDAASLSATAVTNNTTDVAGPVFGSAAVNGASLVMTYTDASQLDATHIPATGAFAVTVENVARAVTGVAVNASAHTVTLTLASAVANGQSVKVAYTDPTTANDTNAIQDSAGNDASSLSATAVTNNTPDTTAPVFGSATVNGSTLVMSYNELNHLDATHIAAVGAFDVQVAGSGDVVTNVAVDGTANTVTLTLTTAVTNGQAVTVAYTDPTGGDDANAIQDSAGNDAATLSAAGVSNLTAFGGGGILLIGVADHLSEAVI